MVQSWKIRPLLWASMIFGVLATLIGSAFAVQAVQLLSNSATITARFEREWAIASISDLQARYAAKLYVATGDQDSLKKFEALTDFRIESLQDAINIAPAMTERNILDRALQSTKLLAEIENRAISLGKSGKLAEAQNLLHSAHYAQHGTSQEVLKERARKTLLSSIELRRKKASNLLIEMGIGISICILLAAVSWWKVGQLFRRQAIELSAARDSLVAHANSLEQRIELRTRDLEMAKSAAEAADHAKSSFLAQMSHEIRTPLNGVLGMAQVLSKTNLDERQKRVVNVIQESGDTLLALLNDVLDLAKIEAGKLELEKVDFKIGDVVRSAEAIFSTRAQEKGLSFAVTIDNNADIYAIGDPTRLRQIIYNLVSNAIKFTEAGKIDVDVGIQEISSSDILLRIAVADTGIGMTDEAIARLFQRFSQADISTTRKFGGSGLGLAICKQLAEMMDGDILVSSQPGEGSVFSLMITLKRGLAPVATDAAAFEKSFAEEGEAAHELRILAAEDNANNRLVLRMFLEQVGIIPVFVENGAEAVDAWKKQEFDCILMDVQMPVMTGNEAASEIRRLETSMGRKRTPIIALTANAMTHHINETKNAGMDLHVAKPIKPELLFAAIDEAISLGEDSHALLAGAA